MSILWEYITLFPFGEQVYTGGANFFSRLPRWEFIMISCSNGAVDALLLWSFHSDSWVVQDVRMLTSVGLNVNFNTHTKMNAFKISIKQHYAPWLYSFPHAFSPFESSVFYCQESGLRQKLKCKMSFSLVLDPKKCTIQPMTS